MPMFAITPLYLTNHNRSGRKISEHKAIILHWTANEKIGADAIANRNYFNGKHYLDKQLIYASAHFIVDDHQIIQCLPEDEVGYHVGTAYYKYTKLARQLMGKQKSPNNVTLGIEMCVNKDGDFEITLEQSIQLTRSLAKKYAIDRNHVLRHFDITEKECPKMLLAPEAWNQFLDRVFIMEQATHQVTAKQLHLRKGPNTTFDSVTKLNQGTKVEVWSTQDDWCLISLGYYVHRNYLSLL